MKTNQLYRSAINKTKVSRDAHKQTANSKNILAQCNAIKSNAVTDELF